MTGEEFERALLINTLVADRLKKTKDIRLEDDEYGEIICIVDYILEQQKKFSK